MKTREGEAQEVLIRKRSIAIAGHRTSISLEEPFWVLMSKMAKEEGVSVAAYVAQIDRARRGGNLSSAIRIHLLERLMALASLEAIGD